MSNPSIHEAAAMRSWMLVCYDEMVTAGYVSPPWSPSGEVHDVLIAYYRVAMTPEEAAEAIFAVRH